MSRLSNFAEKRTTRYILKKLGILGFKFALISCAWLAYHFPIFSDNNPQADGAMYMLIFAVCGFIWWEFCR